IVAVLSLFGAAVPLRIRPGHAQLQLYLSLAAGALLGAAMFHLLPESAHCIDEKFGLPAVAGILLVFLLQRFVAPHSHEAGGAHDHVHSHGEPHTHDHAPHDHGHDESPDHAAHDHHAAPPTYDSQPHGFHEVADVPAAPLLGSLVAI